MLEKITNQNAIDLSELGLIRASGQDVTLFLQGQLTCDLEEINAEQSRLGAHCDAKGRIIAIFRLFFYQNNYYFLLPRNTLPLLLSSLQKYALFSKNVVLVDVSQDFQKIGIYGPTLKSLFEAQKLSFKENEVLELNHVLSVSIPGPVPRVVLLAPLHFIHVRFEQQNVHHWHLLDILAGIPTIYPETSGQFTPHQLNLPELGAVCFHKGCYIGQEIIARTHYLGKSKSRLYRVRFNAQNSFLPGTLLFDSAEKIEQGALMMSAEEDKNLYQALISLQTKAISHTIRLGCPEGPKLEFLELPYSTN
ncbi:YgfZ/GcvT domain-containing protein [Rickettsiella grylli]|uniref:CAF17-like 4Fe-4S cluster assembly/insertion protein YgfZ n=1 Tax=Rickettsiella grylli TaxID=59196 RepID=UPI001C0E4DE8|nr:hypothetical protein [Rickettsiella grylli]